MGISRSWLFGAILLTAAAMLSGCGRSGGGGGATSGGGAGPKSAQGRSLGIMPVGSTLLGLHAGDRIPAQGRSVTALTGKGTTIPLDAPLVLYPNAVVQGVAWVPTPPGFELWVLLGTDDPEATVLQVLHSRVAGAARGPAEAPGVAALRPGRAERDVAVAHREHREGPHALGGDPTRISRSAHGRAPVCSSAPRERHAAPPARRRGPRRRSL